MTIAELKKYAEDNNISLNSTKKEDIIKELKDANKQHSFFEKMSIFVSFYDLNVKSIAFS